MKPRETREQKFITEELVFKAAMNSNFQKNVDLEINNEGITDIEFKCSILKQMSGTLRRFDLSFNQLTEFTHLDILTNLRELNLSFNKIQFIEQLPRLANLKALVLDFNQITKVQNIRGMRKLEKLSLHGNKIKDIADLDIGEPMIELKELNLM